MSGLARADSLALDLHKWMQAPIDVGLALVRDEGAHRRRSPWSGVFLTHATRGMAAGEVWFNEYGIALSRGFRALRVWMALKAYGADAFGQVMDDNMALAHRLADASTPTPTSRASRQSAATSSACATPPQVPGPLDAVNHELVLRIQESGVAVVTDTVLNGEVAIRVAIANHRTRDADLDLFLDTLLDLGSATVADLAPATTSPPPPARAPAPTSRWRWDLTTSPGASPTGGGTATGHP